MAIQSLLRCCAPCFPDCSAFLYIFVTLSLKKKRADRGGRWLTGIAGSKSTGTWLFLMSIVCCRCSGLCYGGGRVGVIEYGQVQQKLSTPAMSRQVRLKGKREITVLCRSSFNVCII
jgi:hypothetical protein